MADVPGSASTTSTLSFGGSTTNSLEANGDHDWFAITLVAGQQYTATVFGITLVDPLLNIRDASGLIIATNDDIKSGSDRNSKITFTPTSSGTYYLDVAGFNEAYAGTYQLSLQVGTTQPLATLDTIAGYLVQGYWGGDAHHFAATQGGTITVNISTLNAGEQNLARTALQEWSDIIGVRFQEVTTGGQITFDNSEDASGSPVAETDSNYSRGITSSAHVHISSSWVNRYGTNLNSYSLQTYVHEIGHALGLGHAGDYNGSATFSTDALFQNDAWSTSIMSYFDERQNTYFGNQGFSRDFAVTPMEADIVAMQTLYGLSTTTRTGDTTYGFNSNAGGVYNASAYPNVALTIFDSGGTDTLDYSGSIASQLLNLNPETFSNVNGQTGNLIIARGVVIENAIAGSGADTIIGNSADNVLTGGGGADTLTGGAGSDTFSDTKAGHNGDVISDFSVGDKIVFSDAALAGFGFSLSGHTLTYTGGSLTLSAVPAGRIAATAAAGGGVALAVVSQDVHSDFNGDGKSDLLWRSDGGYLSDWLGSASGALVSNANATTWAPLNWHVAGTGDFNGDGKDDILWRDDTGHLSNWLGSANGGFTNNDANAATWASTSWAVAGTGDFNGDGKSDILWRSSAGYLSDWLGTASGGFANNDVNAATWASTSWIVAGTGDFNGDGKDDILWRSNTGHLSDWLGTASGGFANNDTNAATWAPTNWQIVGTGDFNGDGKDDILWRDGNGTVTNWLANGTGGFAASTAFSTVVPTEWSVAGIGDFNGDGKDDIAWRDHAGHLSNWLGTASGALVNNDANAATWMSTDWHVQDPFVHDPFA